jgi:HTH-type transcriptional regulator / antitoxin HigA
MITTVKTKKDYHAAMAEIETFLQKGFDKLTAKDNKELQRLNKLVEAYEDVHHTLPIKPDTIEEMIALKMFQKKMKQKDLAKLLGVSDTRISEVMRGKRRINIDLAKRLHSKLGIDADFILKAI